MVGRLGSAALVLLAVLASACSSDTSGAAGKGSGTSAAGSDPCLLAGARLGSCDWRKAPNPKFHCGDYSAAIDAGTLKCQEDGQDLFSAKACDRGGAMGCCVGKDASGFQRIELFYSPTDAEIATCKMDPNSAYHDVAPH